MPGIKDIPGTHTARIFIPVAMASATTDDEYPGFVAPANIKIVAARWVPLAAVTANGTNYTTVSVRNRTTGSGSALPASRSYAATNSTAFVPETMTLSGTAADLLVASGDSITVQRVHTASGVSVPAGVVEVDYQYR